MKKQTGIYCSYASVPKKTSLFIQPDDNMMAKLFIDDHAV
jgi:hypothetical protein